MRQVLMYATATCPFCIRAHDLLQRKGVTDLEIIRVDLEPEKRKIMTELTGRTSVPQIFIHGQHVGGCDDLFALEGAGTLDNMLNPD